MAVLLLFVAAVALGGCTGAAGGSGAEEGEGTIALSLASVTSSRSARAAGEWSTATGTFDGITESKTYTGSVTKTIHSGHNVIALNLAESGGDARITISFSGGTYSLSGYSMSASSLSNISPSADVAIVVSCIRGSRDYAATERYTWSQLGSGGISIPGYQRFRLGGDSSAPFFTLEDYSAIPDNLTVRVESVTVDGVEAVIAGDPEFHRSE